MSTTIDVDRLAPAVARPAAVTRRLAGLLPWLTALLLVGLAVVPYLPALDAYFTGDDFGLIWLFHQKRIGHFLTLFWQPWTENVYGIYADELRPTVGFSYWLDGRLFGAHNPFGFHLDNLLLHAACTLLTWGLARTILRREAPAVAAAAIFAATSIHPEAVTWISGRADLIPTFFYVGAFLAFVRYRRTGRRAALLLALLGAFLALFSKQSGVTFLGLLIAYDLVYGHLRHVRRDWRKLAGRVAAYVPFTLELAGYLLLRRWLFGSTLREDQLGPERIQEFLTRQSYYLQGILFGGELRPPDRPDLGPAEWAALAVVGLGLLATLLTLPSWWRRWPDAWRHLLFFGPIWYGICVLPLLMTYLSPRHLYAATIGNAVFVALLLWLPVVGMGARTTLTTKDAKEREGPRRGTLARTDYTGSLRAWVVKLVPVVAAGVLVWALLGRLAAAQVEWLDAGKVSERAARQIGEIAEALPAGSKVVLLVPPAYGHAYFWAWGLPYATDQPFAAGDLYGRHQVVEAPSAYCCPVPVWWAARAPTIARWLNEAPTIHLVTVGWDGPAGAFDIDARDASTADLRARIEAMLGGPISATVEVSEDQVTAIVQILQGP